MKLYQIIKHECVQKSFNKYELAIDYILHDGENSKEYKEFWKAFKTTIRRVFIFNIFGFKITIEKDIKKISANDILNNEVTKCK
jgi:hypothetical protein